MQSYFSKKIENFKILKETKTYNHVKNANIVLNFYKFMAIQFKGLKKLLKFKILPKFFLLLTFFFFIALNLSFKNKY